MPPTLGAPDDPDRATYVTRRYPSDSALTDWSDRDRVYRKIHALRDDAHPAHLPARESTSLLRAERGDRRFVGSVATTVVGRRDGLLEVVCGDGRTLWIGGAGLSTFRINDKLLPQ